MDVRLLCLLCYVGSGLCDGLIIHQRSPTGCVCIIVCELEISERGDLGPILGVVPQTKN
jgi:hypothetical protein